jgi:glycosyltransferase involved in cell wall biosynthesis
MSKTISLSILISWHNGLAYLPNIEPQILKATSMGIKVILIDDGSIDGSDLKLRKLSEELHLFSYQKTENLGSASARNLAKTIVSTDYFIFMDSDDVLDFHNLLQNYEQILHAGTDLLVSDYKRIPGNKIETAPKVEKRIKNHRSELFQSMGFWRYIYKTNSVKELFFYPNFYQAGGYFILDDAFYMLQIASSNLTITNGVPQKPFYTYKISNNSEQAWTNYLGQVEKLPLIITKFLELAELKKIELDHDWLVQSSLIFLTTSINRLTFPKLIRNIFQVRKARKYFSSKVSIESLQAINSGKLLWRSLKNSVYPYFQGNKLALMRVFR